MQVSRTRDDSAPHSTVLTGGTFLAFIVGMPYAHCVHCNTYYTTFIHPTTTMTTAQLNETLWKLMQPKKGRRYIENDKVSFDWNKGVYPVVIDSNGIRFGDMPQHWCVLFGWCKPVAYSFPHVDNCNTNGFIFCVFVCVCTISIAFYFPFSHFWVL